LSIPEEKKRIDKLEIRNFKSIRELGIRPSKVNLFIGEPNTGKSNILEALGIWSALAFDSSKLKSFVRFQSFSNLFFEDNIDNDIQIRINKHHTKINQRPNGYSIEIKDEAWNYDYDGKSTGGSSRGPAQIVQKLMRRVRYYKYLRNHTMIDSGSSQLNPPNGNNLFSIIYSSKENRRILIDFMKPFGLTPVFKPQPKMIEFQKQQEDEIINYPYEIASDTIKSMIFYIFALRSNKDAILLFEEPESHTFPYYTKQIGEMIALDKNNQYFLVTHNPYFLSAILEKSETQDVNVYITYMEDYETKIKLLSDVQKEELLDYDPFANLSSFL